LSLRTENIKFIATKSSGEVSGILSMPDDSECLLLFAHGAGAGMRHNFMERMSANLNENRIGTLRYNFPYVEKKKRAPDPAPVLMETVRSAFRTAGEFSDKIPILAGGKSMGGRMTSMAASENKLDGVEGIIFFGFPLHAPGKPSDERAVHLYKVNIPMLFLQGTRDKLADLSLLKPVVRKLKDKATLHIFEGADHSFHLSGNTGSNDDQLLKEMAAKVAEWSRAISRH